MSRDIELIFIAVCIFSIPVAILIYLIRSGRKEQKELNAFMSLVSQITGGSISKPMLSLTANIIVKGQYKNREAECRYVEVESGGLFDSSEGKNIYLCLRPFKAPQQRSFLLSYTKISDKILFKKGWLIYKPFSIFESRIFDKEIKPDLINSVEEARQQLDALKNMVNGLSSFSEAEKRNFIVSLLDELTEAAEKLEKDFPASGVAGRG